ncbi:MAG TPA: hypothetical protein VGM81_23905 [Burkholderiaceae bacterium]
MHSIEHPRYGSWLLATFVALLSGCTPIPLATPAPQPQPSTRPEPTRPAPTPVTVPPTVVPQGPRLDPPKTPRNADELRHQAALRLVAANPEQTYMGKPQDVLLGIPVLEIELNADGTVRHIRVMRSPSEAPETVKIAIEAVYRAAPYGNVSRLPKPWTFIETFLFNDDLRFKPRSLDEG